MTKLSEESEFTIPLKNLIALVVFVGVAATAYFNLTERVSFNEHQHELLGSKVKNLEGKVGNFIPKELITGALDRQRTLELTISRMDQRLKALEEELNKQ